MKGQDAPVWESFSSLIRSFHTGNSLGLRLEMVTFHTYITYCLMLPWNDLFATLHNLDKQLPAISILINLLCLVQTVTLLIKKKKKLIKMGVHPPIWKTASYSRKTEASNCIHLPCEVLLCKYICAGGSTHILSISNTNAHTKYLCFYPTTRNQLNALNFISKGQTSRALYNPKAKTK